MVTEPSLIDLFEECGRVWLRNALPEEDLALFDTAASVSEKAGQRLDFSVALDAALSEESPLVCAARRLEPKTVPVRVVAFNKSDSANWSVPWHQDRVIAVTEKADVAGYTNWSKKSGTWHCEPPETILKEMLFVRVHLDDTDELNGAMEIAVGSHAAGVISSENAEEVAKSYPIETCTAKRGDVLILKMLTLHSSKAAKVKSGRRVLRIDFSASQLPSPLSWSRHSTKT